MSFLSRIAKVYAKWAYKKTKADAYNAVHDQEKIMQELITKAKHTQFGKDHDFSSIISYEDYTNKVPIRDYEALKPYIEKVKDGEPDVLWPGKPAYFAKTSGTTSGSKYIPITRESMPNHIGSTKKALLTYIATTGKADFLEGNMIFLSGSPELDHSGHIPTGRLSGIVNHHVPDYLKKHQLPSFETNCIEDWEAKLEKIVAETLPKDMTLISGIPPWVQMYLDKLQEKTGKKIKDVFPNLSLIVYGGVNFEPYRKRLFETIGREVDSIELFPASEGFFAFQDTRQEAGMLLTTNSGIFYEFVPAEEIFDKNPTRLYLKDVELYKNYALIVSNNAGLWAYNIGDTVKFVHLDPYRVIVSGRTKHFISAFGEHVIAEEVDSAISEVAQSLDVHISEYTVAPFVAPTEGDSYHEWFVEFEKAPEDIKQFALELDNALRKKNTYYEDLVGGNILQSLRIRPIKKNGFIQYMQSQGRLGGQNKLPRLSNDRAIADALQEFLI